MTPKEIGETVTEIIRVREKLVKRSERVRKLTNALGNAASFYTDIRHIDKLQKLASDHSLDTTIEEQVALGQQYVALERRLEKVNVRLRW